MLRGFGTLVRTQWRLLLREPGYWITSIGLAAIIIVVYGSVLSNPGGPELGVVLEDNSPALAEGVKGLDSIEGIDVTTGTAEEELRELDDGERWAVIIFPPETIERARNRLEAPVRVVYNDASPFEATAGQGIFREFVAEINRTLDVALELDVTVESIEAERGIGLLETLFPGLIGMSLMLGNTLAAGMFVSWRQMGIMRRISASPVRPLTLEVAQFVTLLVTSALQVIVLVALAQLLFGVHVAGSYFTLAIIGFIGAVAFMGIWYALAALVANPTTFFASMNLASFVMMFLGGSVVPTEDVPSWLDPLIEALPLTHLNDALRGVINDADDLGSVSGKLAILAAWAVAGFALSIRLFRWERA